MLNWFRKPVADPNAAIRETLFGDMPWEAWGREDQLTEPWVSFTKARIAAASGLTEEAKALLHAVLAQPQLESRHCIQAWTFLRQIGDSPSAGWAKHVLGVVVEVAMKSGTDLLAAYEDSKARYFNFSGAAVIWERPDDSCDAQIKSLLAAGQAVADRIGPWNEPRRSVPPAGTARLNMLTPSGLHIGEAPQSVLASDGMAGPVLTAATALMQQLIQKARNAQDA